MLTRCTTTIALALGLFSLSACNAVTGVDDLQIKESDGGSKVFLEPLLTIPGITIKEISVYQGVKAQIMVDGAPTMPKVPVVAGRDALVRVFVATGNDYTGEAVTARLFLQDRPEPFEVTVDTLPKASDEKDLKTTINIPIPGSAITTFSNYKILLGKPSGKIPGPSTDVLYPTSDWDTLPAHTSGPLKLVLVPVQYGGDGSNRVPDLSTDIQKQYADGFRALYPITDISLSVHAPVPWAQPLSPDGTGWPELLDAITMLRQTDSADFDVYYFAVFKPANSFGLYCGAGCVLGLANLAFSPQDASLRAGIGCAFADKDSIETAVHEIGHTHGRQHAPGTCGAQGTDPSFPYADGKDGIWGYNLVTSDLYDPTVYNDVMGYCLPNWISDYTYSALFDRVQAVNMAGNMPRIETPAELRDRTYERILINQRGEMKWMPPVKMAIPPHGEARKVVIETRGGDEATVAQFTRMDHLDGGTLLWPSTVKPATAIRFDYAGKSQRVTHP